MDRIDLAAWIRSCSPFSFGHKRNKEAAKTKPLTTDIAWIAERTLNSLAGEALDRDQANRVISTLTLEVEEVLVEHGDPEGSAQQILKNTIAEIQKKAAGRA